MQYLLLIYENESRYDGLDENARRAALDECFAFDKEHAAVIKSTNALQPTTTATTVRVREGQRLVTDGPFMETKEQLGGYCLLEAADLEQAIAIAARIPSARHGAVEVRPILTFQDM